MTRTVPPATPPPGRITLRDLKRCRLAGAFFDTFFNIDKYLEREQREQAAPTRVGGAGARGGAGVGGAGWGQMRVVVESLVRSGVEGQWAWSWAE